MKIWIVIKIQSFREHSIFSWSNNTLQIPVPPLIIIPDIILDETKPDGTYLKRLDTSKINDMGWFANIELEKGLKMTYEWALKNKIFENEN